MPGSEATWSKARLCKALGMFGEEYEQVDQSVLCGKEEALLLISDALRCVQTRDRARLVLQHVTLSLDLTNSLCSYERADPLRVYPMTRTDPCLARLVRAKEGQLNKRTASVKQIPPNEWQARYVESCNTMVVETRAGESVSPTMNRSVYEKLGGVTEATTAFDFSAHMLGERGVMPLCKALLGHPAIRTINLSWNDVREASLQFVEELVESCPSLSSVDLTHNKFLAATAGRLLMCMVRRFANQLRYVNIDNCSIPAYFAKSIQIALGQDDGDDTDSVNLQDDLDADDPRTTPRRPPGLIREAPELRCLGCRRMPQCSHCEFFFLDEPSFDGHLTVFHPHTHDAAKASERLLQRAKQRSQQGRPAAGATGAAGAAQREPSPMSSPSRNMEATLYAERFDPLPSPRQHHDGRGQAVHASVPPAPPPAAAPAGPPQHMEARRDTIVQRDLENRDQHITLQQMAFENETRARLEREYLQRRREDMQRHTLEVQQAYLEQRTAQMEKALAGNRERRREAETRINAKLENEIEPTIRRLFDQGKHGPLEHRMQAPPRQSVLPLPAMQPPEQWPRPPSPDASTPPAQALPARSGTLPGEPEPPLWGTPQGHPHMGLQRGAPPPPPHAPAGPEPVGFPPQPPAPPSPLRRPAEPGVPGAGQPAAPPSPLHPAPGGGTPLGAVPHPGHGQAPVRPPSPLRHERLSGAAVPIAPAQEAGGVPLPAHFGSDVGQAVPHRPSSQQLGSHGGGGGGGGGYPVPQQGLPPAGGVGGGGAPTSIHELRNAYARQDMMAVQQGASRQAAPPPQQHRMAPPQPMGGGAPPAAPAAVALQPPAPPPVQRRIVII